jgi:putative SOS response-associated peptidase YedK
MAFAGLWESWMGPNGEEMETAAIVTTTASRSIAHIHDRMPVIVAPDAFDFWLDPNVDGVMAGTVIAPAPDALLEAYEVSSAVNRTANDSAELLEPLSEPEVVEAVEKPKRVKKEKEKKDNGQASLF